VPPTEFSRCAMVDSPNVPESGHRLLPDSPIATTRKPTTRKSTTRKSTTRKRSARVGRWILFDDERTETLTPLHLRRRQSQDNLEDDRAPVPIADDVAGVINVADVEDVTDVAAASSSESGPATVVVVGGGSNESVSLVTTLEVSGHKVVAAEHDPYSAALRLAQFGAVIPAPGDPQFAKALGLVAKQSDARAVLATGSAEIRAVAEARRDLEEIGVASWSPSLDVIALCADRSALYEALDSSGLSVEKTGIGPSGKYSGKGRKFNVDAIVGRDHEVLAAVSSWRLAKDGDTTLVAETFFDPRLLELIRATCATILIEGPVVIEGYASEFGRALLNEVRPGFSSLVPLARAAGVDVASLALQGTLGREMPTRLIPHRSGVRTVRYLDQVFED
jgi:hypothetical protein